MDGLGGTYHDWWDRNNPLNNGLGSGGGGGLGSYANLLVAAHYVALNLEEGTADYGAIVADLKASAAPSTTARAIWDSPWAASHYGYGSAWHSGPVATVAAQAPRGERLTASTPRRID